MKKNQEGHPEIAAAINRVTQADAFPQFLGIRFGNITPGYAEATLEIKKETLNFMGVTHGGAIFTLADTAFGAAANAYGQDALTIHATINYLHATSVGAILTAKAVEESRTRRVSHYRVTIADEQDRLIATFHGIAYIKKKD